MKKISTSTVFTLLFIFQFFTPNQVFALEALGNIDTIRITPKGSRMIAEIDPIPGATNYQWTVGNAGSILSGQGTPTLKIDWSTTDATLICVTAENSNKQTTSKCKRLFNSADTPCLPTPGGTPAGNDPPGCYLCDSIYLGSTAQYSPSFPSNAFFPCGTIENNQFISILADSTGNLSASIIASACQNNQGVELVIYDIDFNPVSNCFFSGGTNLPGVVRATGLIPGDTYWIMIDGYLGDICDFALTISGGVNSSPPDPPGQITINPDTTPLCPGAIVTYSIAPVNGANEYEWLIPANANVIDGGLETDPFVVVEYTAPGGGVVRVTPNNPCFPGIPAIEPVVVLPILPTLKPPEAICPHDFPIVRDGNVFTDHGSQEITYTTALGCDSVVTYVFVPVVQIPNVIDTTICAGECVQIGFDCYDQPIAQRITLGHPFSQANGCDSIVILKINILDPIAWIQSPQQIGCDPGDVVDLDGTASSSGTGVSYEWTTSNGGVIAGPSNTNFTQVSAPGTYILTVTQSDTLGKICVARDTAEVSSMNTGVPFPIFTQAETSVCVGSSHIYSVAPVSGAFPNGYQWTLPPGASISGNINSNSVEITFGNQPLNGNVCVLAMGPCGDSQPACIPVTVNAAPSSDFDIPPLICQNDTATITYTGTASPFANFTWNFNGGKTNSGVGVGPHEVHWESSGTKVVSLQVEENGCVHSRVEKIITVDSELPELFISCATTNSSIDFSWNTVSGADDYKITVNGFSSNDQPGTDFSITGLNQGDEVTIEVEAQTNSICGSRKATATCTAQNCPPFDLNINPIADICRDASTGTITLSANPSGGAGGGTMIWKGNGVTSNTFDPLDAKSGINVVALEYTEGLCTTIETIEIVMTDVPTANFVADNLICVDELSQVIYTGSADYGSNFNWDFGAGTIVAGQGAGPYEIDYAGNNGIQTVRLSIEENGCISPLVSQTIQVDAPLDAPIVRCAATTSTSVAIEWDVVPGLTYTVNPSIGAIDMASGTIHVDGLQPGEIVTLTITAEGISSCGVSQTTITCEASNCPPIPVMIDPIGPFCKDGMNPTIQLNATAGDNTGSFTWSGPGVSQPNIFNPNSSAINPGIVTISVLYQKDNCSYRGFVDVEVFEKPNADFSSDDPICIDSVSNISYLGSASANATFDWEVSANGTFLTNNVGSDPFQIRWSESGMNELSLVVTENGCISDKVTSQIQVDEPLTKPIIFCNSDQSNINFDWNPVVDAISYDAKIISTNVSGLPTDPHGFLWWNFGGLSPGDFIEIEVTANGATACGPTSSKLLCTARNCLDYNVIMPQIDTCLYSNIQGFDLIDQLFIVNLLGENLIDSINMLWIGSPNTNYLTASGTFFPSTAVNELGLGDIPISVEIEYPKNSGCFKTFNSIIRLKPVPQNAISMPSESCISETATAVLTNAIISPDVSFDWDFGNATILTGQDGGPYEIVWDEAQTDTISVRVTEEGCVSDLISAEIRIDNELANLNLQCDLNNSGNQQIGFIWDDIGADELTIEVVSSNASPFPVANLSTNTSAFFDGLTPSDEITLAVIAENINSACPSVSDTITCVAKTCPPTTLEIEPFGPFCEGENIETQLKITIINDPTNGTGAGSWSGSMISPTGFLAATGTPAGKYLIVYTYTSNGCSYNTTYEFEILPQPKLTAEVQNDIWQIGSSGNIDLTVSGGSSNYQFVWSNNTFEEDLSDVSPGDYCVTVVDQNGCDAADCYIIGNGIYRLSPIEIMCRGERKNLTIRPGRGADFNWFPTNGLSCSNCANPVASPSESTTYTVTATLPNGRFDSTKVFVFVLPQVLCNSPRIAEISAQIEQLDLENFDKKELEHFEKKLIQTNAVSIAPNPTSGIVNISSIFDIENAEVFDFSGRNVFSKKDIFAKEGTFEIDLSNLAKGVYFIKIKTGGKVVVKRVVLI